MLRGEFRVEFIAAKRFLMSFISWELIESPLESLGAPSCLLDSTGTDLDSEEEDLPDEEEESGGELFFSSCGFDSSFLSEVEEGEAGDCRVGASFFKSEVLSYSFFPPIFSSRPCLAACILDSIKFFFFCKN